MPAPEIEVSTIHPLVGEVYLNQLLGASPEIVSFCGDRFAVGKNGFEWKNFDASVEDKNLWPFILFFPSEDAQSENFADQFSTLETATYSIWCFVREDLLTKPANVEEVAARGRMAIDAALNSAFAADIHTTDNEGFPISGHVSGVSVAREIHRDLTGERGQQRCTMGRTVRVLFS